MSARRCRVCGCTDNRACWGGCWWVAEELCSSCQTDLPILFTDEMVREIEEERKTQTRRPVKFVTMDGQRLLRQLERHRMRAGVVGHLVDFGNAITGGFDTGRMHNPTLYGGDTGWWPWCPFGGPGGRLWVRQTWQHDGDPAPYEEGGAVFYRSDYLDDPHGPDGERSREGRYRSWRPSIHMPRAACRLRLEITSVRLERLQAITDEDAIAEGIRPLPSPIDVVAVSPREMFAELWESSYGRGSWHLDPWVWAIEFKKVSE